MKHKFSNEASARSHSNRLESNAYLDDIENNAYNQKNPKHN